MKGDIKLQKQVHVNSYVRKDGTQVKEHYRNIETDYSNSWNSPEGWSPKNMPQMANTGIPEPTSNIGEKIKDILGAVFTAGGEILPIALQMHTATSTANRQAADYLKPVFDERINKAEKGVAQIKKYIDNGAKQLANTRNQVEYASLYDDFMKNYEKYLKARNIIDRVKSHVNNNDFKSVAAELENFQNEKLNQIASLINPNPQTIEKVYNRLSTTVQNIKPEIDKFINVAKFSKGPLYLLNNYTNYNRPEARKLMDLSLNLPKDTYSNNEYSMIQPIFNEKLNEYLHNIGTNLQVTKNMKGIVFDKSSSISQKLSNFKQLQKDIRANYNKDIKYISGLGIDTDTNLQYAVGHFTILNPRIEKGVFKGELFDIYDFDWINLNDLDNIEGVIANNIAFLLQIIRLKNYYFLIPIEFIW